MSTRTWDPERIRLVVLDWDGTLVDSRQAIITTLQAAFREAGHRVPSSERCQEVIGLGLREALAALAPDTDEDQRDRLQAVYSRHFQGFGARDMPFFPGVFQGLNRLRERGFLLGIATGKSRRGLDRMLEEWGLGDAFHATRCADETASKPDPRMLRELLGTCRAMPGEAVFVGDTAFDMEMAYRLDIPRIAVTYGMHERERLAPWQPQAWAEDFTQVMGQLDGGGLASPPAEGYN